MAARFALLDCRVVSGQSPEAKQSKTSGPLSLGPLGTHGGSPAGPRRFSVVDRDRVQHG